MENETFPENSEASAENSVEVLDTTLRDGVQGEGIAFSLQDKLAVVKALDELGVAWIEAGNPASNPKDTEFFQLASSLELKNAKLCAFGSTRKKKSSPENDPQLQSLLAADTQGVVVFGKSWDLHAADVLGVSLNENLAMIHETLAYLKALGKFVIYDAEHFFDGYRANPAYALETIAAALDAGADRIVLCDTNGGFFPDEILPGISAVEDELKRRAAPGRDAPLPLLGIHAHNDSGMAAALTVAALKAGCRHIQGTLTGCGERCGNTALAALIPSIELKLGLRCLPAGSLRHISEISRKVAEITNVALPEDMPYVGRQAFAHKAGMHADGILKINRSFEHVDPASVGNDRRFLVSEIGGRSVVAERAKKIDPSINKDHPVAAALVSRLKRLDADGWQFEGADASFEILVRRELGRYQPFFKIIAYRVVSEHPSGESMACSHAWIKVYVDGQYEIAAAEGEGPVNALDGAMRLALKRFYPELEKVRLIDYKVRVIDGNSATAAKVRVLIESTDGWDNWTTVGVSADIIEASRAALVDSIEYKLISDIERKFKAYL